jgi:hypothetical protein
MKWINSVFFRYLDYITLGCDDCLTEEQRSEAVAFGLKYGLLSQRPDYSKYKLGIESPKRTRYTMLGLFLYIAFRYPYVLALSVCNKRALFPK